LDILPSGLKFTSDYFYSNVIEALGDVLYPDGRRPRTVRYMLHFDNAPVHNAEKVQHKLDECDFRKLEHPPYSLDLSLCDFFLFGYLHEKMKFLSYQTVEKLEEAITRTIEAIPKPQLIRVFQGWRRRLETCIQHEGNYFE
jgi:hypothetical protein